MRTLALILLLTTPAFIGCLGGDDPGTPLDAQSNEDPMASNDTPPPERFSGNEHGTSGANASQAQGDDAPEELDAVPLDPVVPHYRLTGFGGGEPTMGVTSSGAIFVTADDELIRSQDGGASWEAVQSISLEERGVPVYLGLYRSWDPMMWVDPITDRVFFDPLFPPLVCTEMAWSDDEGETWFERGPVCHAPPMDHQKLASGVPGPDGPPMAGEDYPTVLYHCYGQPGGVGFTEPVDGTGEIYAGRAMCAVSYDGGLTWPINQPVADNNVDGCGGNIGHPAVGPDGTVAVPITHTLACPEPYLAISTDSGLTWDVVTVPAEQPGIRDDPEVSFAPDGTVYVTYTGIDHITYVARTPDLGESWDGPYRVTPPSVQSTVFHATDTGPDGRFATAFLGTRDTDQGADDAPDQTHWHLFIVTSEDAASADPTFTSYQVTPNSDPVQVGRICMSGATCMDGSRNLLDFIDGTAGPNGTFYVSYTEGCTEGCAGTSDPDPTDSRDKAVALAWLEGWSLGEQSMGLAGSNPAAHQTGHVPGLTSSTR